MQNDGAFRAGSKQAPFGKSSHETVLPNHGIPHAVSNFQSGASAQKLCFEKRIRIKGHGHTSSGSQLVNHGVSLAPRVIHAAHLDGAIESFACNTLAEVEW